MDSQDLLSRLALAALVAIVPALATAQPAKPAAPAPIVKAEQALAKGQFQDAAETARTILKAAPADARAATVLVTALARSEDVDAAYEAYEQHVRLAKKDDAALLAPIAEATLRQLSKERASEISAEALAALATRGDKDSRDRLRALAQPKPPEQPSVMAVAALAALGDTASKDRLAQYLSGPVAGPKITAIRVLATAAPTLLPSLLESSFADANPFVKVAAVDAAAETGAKSLVPSVRKAMEERDGLVRLHAAAALQRLGDPAGKEILDAAFASGLPDAAVIAASAYAGSTDKSWVKGLTPVLQHENRLMAVRAAALLVPTAERDAALSTLRTALQDQSPVVRDEAAQALAAAAAGDLALLRPLLRDANAFVRLRAGKAVLSAKQ